MLHTTPRGFLCLRCLTKAPARAANAWLMRVCPGTPALLEQGGLHHTHALASSQANGLILCRRCGAWTTWAFRNLARPCRDNPPPFFAYALRRLERGLPPIPPPRPGRVTRARRRPCSRSTAPTAEGRGWRSAPVVKIVREAAVAAAVAIVGGMHPFAIEAAKPAFGLALASKRSRRERANPQHRRRLPEQVPEIRRQLLVTLAMPVAERTCDIKKEVKEAAVICMPVNCGCTGNKDLEPFPPPSP